jgi:hypothetical protein
MGTPDGRSPHARGYVYHSLACLCSQCLSADNSMLQIGSWLQFYNVRLLQDE